MQVEHHTHGNWQVTQFLSPSLTTTTTEDRHARVARRQLDDWSFVNFVSALFFQRVIGDDYRPGILSGVHEKGTFWNVWSHVSCVVHVFHPFRLFLLKSQKIRKVMDGK